MPLLSSRISGAFVVASVFLVGAGCGGTLGGPSSDSNDSGVGASASSQANVGSAAGSTWISAGSSNQANRGSSASSTAVQTSTPEDASPVGQVDLDATTTVVGPVVSDASLDIPPAPPGLAGFAFVVDGVVQTPLGCSFAAWEYPPVHGEPDGSCYLPSDGGPSSCAGFATAVIVNTGATPLAYIAMTRWGGPYSPGVANGEPQQLAGVIGPGQQVDISSVFVGGVTALLGSADPFTAPDAGTPYADEGIIPWPLDVAGSGGSTSMYTAEIEVESACTPPFHGW